MDELYELVLKMYINLNRQAPVPPPTRETVKDLYHQADADGSNSIDQKEFRKFEDYLFQSLCKDCPCQAMPSHFGSCIGCTNCPMGVAQFLVEGKHCP